MSELNAFSERLEVLQAQEAIQRANEIGVGTGAMKKEDRKNILRGWNRVSGASAAYRRAARQNAKAAGNQINIPGIGKG